jgi:23S rRNA pseudouridine2605 synthase
MTEGRKREVRRLFAAVGLTVERLARVAYGGVELGELRQGKWRFLTQSEIGALHAAVAERPSDGRGTDTSTSRQTDASTGNPRTSEPSTRQGTGGRGRRSGRRERDARAANAARATRRGGQR